MKWKILVEDTPGEFVDAKIESFDDGFNLDASEWGQEQSDAIAAYLASLTKADKRGRSYSATIDTSSPAQMEAVVDQPDFSLLVEQQTALDNQVVIDAVKSPDTDPAIKE